MSFKDLFSRKNSMIRKVVSLSYKNVNQNGTFSDGTGGAIATEGRIVSSKPNDGCGLGSCDCSDGHWINVMQARTEQGTVEGFTIFFYYESDMKDFVKKNYNTEVGMWTYSQESYDYWRSLVVEYLEENAVLEAKAEKIKRQLYS